MKTVLRKHKWFWAWQDDREEAWLMSMASQGWHLAEISPFGFYAFKAGPASNTIYRLDFQHQIRKGDVPDYLQLFADSGWEHVGQMGGWQYFRKPGDSGGNMELYTNVESKLQKYQRIAILLVCLMPIMLLLVRRLSDAAGQSDWYAIPMFLVFGLLLVYIYAMIQFIRRISQLKHARDIRQ